MGVGEVKEMREMVFWIKDSLKLHLCGKSVWLTAIHLSVITMLPCVAAVLSSFSLK